VPLKQSDREKTAFKIPKRGLFHFKKMPFGLSGASQTMAALMDKVLGSDLEPYVYFYLDDVIIATETFGDHIRVLKEVANRLKSANLSVNLKKSHFTKKSVKFLGYVLSEKGLTVDPEKVRAILSYPAPKNIRECHRLMGVAGWYQRFIKDFSLLTAPISMDGRCGKGVQSNQGMPNERTNSCQPRFLSPFQDPMRC
jgi:hypothetical protein